MTNEASLLNKYASAAFAGLVAPVLDGVQVSATPADGLLSEEGALFRMYTELKGVLDLDCC